MKTKIANFIYAAVMLLTSVSVNAQTRTPQSQMEPLTRGLVSIHKSSSGNFVSWRLLGTDPVGTHSICCETVQLWHPIWMYVATMIPRVRQRVHIRL